MNITAYTDGSSKGNPGRSGWAYVLTCVDSKGVAHTLENSGRVKYSTNNVMELTAVYECLNAITKPCTVHVITDSKGVINWLTGKWKRKNEDIKSICANIDALVSLKELTLVFEWVKGHAGDTMNERANALAQEASAE